MYTILMQWRNQSHRPRGITLVVIVQIIYGVISVLFGIFFTFIAYMMISFMYGILGIIPWGALILPIIPLSIGIISFIIGRALYVGKGWSWKAIIILNIFSIFNIIITFGPLLFSPQSSSSSVSQFLESSTGLFSLIFNIIYSIITLPYMLRSKTRAYFGKVKIDI